MSRREDIDNAIWTDPDFEALSAEATLLYLWSWTNPRCGMAGIYKVSTRTMAESKVPLTQIPSVLVELAAASFAFYEQQVLWVRTRVKHLRSRSPQMAASVVADLRKLPPTHPLVARFIETYRLDRWLRDVLAEAYRDGIGDLSESPENTGDLHTLSVGSVDPPGKGKGQRSGSSSSTEGSQGDVRVPAAIAVHARIVFEQLSEFAAAHALTEINRASLGRVVRSRQLKPLVRACEDYLAWQERVPPAQRHKDLIRGYQWQLDNRYTDLAATEPLTADGLPLATSVSALTRSTPDKYTAAALRNTERMLGRTA